MTDSAVKTVLFTSVQKPDLAHWVEHLNSCKQVMDGFKSCQGLRLFSELYSTLAF